MAHEFLLVGEHEPLDMLCPGQPLGQQGEARTAGPGGPGEVNWAGVTILSRSFPTAAEVVMIGAIPTRPPETELRGVEGLEPTAVGPGCGTSIGIHLGRQDGLVRRGDRRCDR